MSLTTIRIGRYTGGAPEADTGLIAADASRACVFDPATDNVWVVLGGFVGGKVSGNVSARISVYDTDASKNPRTRLGYMAVVSVTTIMVGGGDGTHYTAAVSGSDNGPTNDAIMIWSGIRHALDILSKNASMRHSMVSAAAITADNEQFYNRTAPGDPPPSAYGAYSASVEGHETAYLEGYLNEAPIAPANGLYPTGTITETAPVFTADFDDLNGAYGTANGGVDTGDRLNAYRLQLREVGTTTLLWDTPYSATSAEKTADAISRAYGGSALTRGVQYEWRVKMSDEFGTYSSYSAWTSFTPASLGYVTLDGNPTGKIEDNTPDFEGRWNHQSATTMKTCMVRIKSSTGTVLQTGSDYNIADVASSALPGTLFTIPWASSGLTTLAWGTSYRYEIRGYDGTNWSDWSTYRTFNTDAAPTVPALSSPASGAIVTAYPLLTFTMSDSDDTTATGLTGVIRITRPDLSTVDVTPTYNATSGKWEYQTTAVQITAFGVYSWKATGYDGTLYSGEAAALGSATWSSSNTFDYENGPVVTVTSPADLSTVTGATLAVAWTATGQVKYQVILYADSSSTIVYDSGLITSANQSHEIPSGYLRNGVSYDLVVSVTNSTPLTGSSSIVNIAVAFTAPTAVANFQVNPASIGIDPFDTAIRLTWDQTAYAAPDFQETIIYRSADGGPDADQVILARITSPGTVQFVDYTPASGYEYTYGISVTIITGLDTLESTVVEGTATVTLLGTVLTLVGNGGTYRACLINVQERGFDRQITEAVYQALSETKPVTVRSVARVWSGSYDGLIIGDTTATAKQRWDELDALDAQPGIVCIRDGRQRKRFCKISDLKQTDEKTDYFGYSFGAREETCQEGTT